MVRYKHILRILAIVVFTLCLFVGSSIVIPYYDNYFQAKAQLTSPDLAKVLVDNAVQALQSGDVNKTIMHSKAAEQELLLLLYTQYKNNNLNGCFSNQSLSTLPLINAVIQSLQNGNDSKALLFLDLADKQLGQSILNGTNGNICATAPTIPTGTFLVYANLAFGIRVQYPYNWIIDGTSHKAGTGGIQTTSFNLPDASIGLPFFRIGVDNLSKGFAGSSKANITDYLVKSIKDKNSTGFPGFKLLEYNTNNTLAGNRAYTIMWTYINPSFGLRKSIELGTIIGNKGYFVDYTAAESKFQNYLPVAQKMIKSFEIINSTTAGLNRFYMPLNGL
jgi:hypothetical protein